MTETKEFCKAFKEKGYRIDYSFVFWSKNVSHILLVIGSNYWQINASDLDNLQLMSNESSVSDLFSTDYLLAFSLKRDDHYVYGFLKV